MVAGIDHARGEVLVTMDGDLQNDPGDIPLFLDKIDEGYDLVVGWRHHRQDHWSRVLPSKVANWLIAWVTGVPIKDNGCSLKAYRADLIKQHPALLRDAPVHPGDGLAGGAAPRPDQGPPSPAQVRQLEIRLLAHLQGGPRPDLDPHPAVVQPQPDGLARHAGRRGLALLSLLALVLSLTHGTASSGRPSVVFAGLCVLSGAFAVFMTFLGVLNHLIYRTAASRYGDFVTMAAKPIGTEP